jgi:hypothetical protein
MLDRWGLLAIILLSSGAETAQGQDSMVPPPDSTQLRRESAWTQIVQQEGIQFSYILYGEADTENNGLVLRLRNRNDYAVRYDFTVIFRGAGGEERAQAEGALEAGEMKTGEKDGLFWIPFENGRSIGEVGLRGIEVEPLQRTSRPQ